jgi:hypothetical protein
MQYLWKQFLGGVVCFYPKVIWTIFDPFDNYYISCFLLHYQTLLDQKNDLRFLKTWILLRKLFAFNKI